jgi:DNA-binding MarR family transcriptional regulator
MGDHEEPLWRRAATHTLHTSIMLKSVLEERLVQEVGILLADNEALLNVAHAAAPLRMSDIAERLVLSRGGTTKVIDRLEELGLVSRQADPEDRRAVVVEITPEGREVLARARTVIDASLSEMWAATLSDDEAKVVIEVMDRVIAAHHAKDR